MDKPQRYITIEQKIWDNLNSNEILGLILERSVHSSSFEDYVSVDFYNEFQYNTVLKDYMMWIKINIEHKDKFQPVTPKIYRITKDREEQIELCNQIWNEITTADIKYIAKIVAEDYHSGARWMDTSQGIKMNKFYPAIQTDNVDVTLKKEFAQYTVSIKKN